MSRAAVGSSSRTIRASCARARATTARCFSPPLSVPSSRSPYASRSSLASARAAASRSRRPSFASAPRCGVRPSSTYSPTVSQGGVDGSCGTTASRRESSARRIVAVGRPSSAMDPANDTSRAMARNNVVLPPPFGPIRASHSPGATSRSIPSTTGRPPSSTVTSSRVTALIGQPWLAYERVEGCGEPGGSPRSREEGGCAGETWFPPRTRAEGERCVSNAFHLRVPEEPGWLHEEDDEDDSERERQPQFFGEPAEPVVLAQVADDVEQHPE